MSTANRLLLLLCIALVSLAMAAPAAAQAGDDETQVATLTGEGLGTHPGWCLGGFPFPEFPEVCITTGPTTKTFRVRCNPDGSGTYSYSVTGVAVGPYPGTFSESGTVKFGPRLSPFPGPYGASLVESFEANFHIDSALADVDGRKFLRSPAPSGFCGEGSPQFGFQSQFLTTLLRYEATIHPITGGSFEDEGRVLVSSYAITAANPLGQEVQTGNADLTEIFASDFDFARPPGPATVVVTPKTAANPVRSQHTVTATALDAGGDPVANVKIHFTITGSVNEERACVTGQDGQCSITYRGPTFPGADVIVACADSDNDGQADPGEPCDEATKQWVLPVSTPGQTTGGGQILHLNSTGTTFGFAFSSDENGLKGECQVLDHAPAENKVNCLNVLAYVQSANEATIYGNATVNGEDAGLFRLHVVDNGESGIGRDLFELETQSGYVRAGTLTQGDVQVHPVDA